MKKDLINGLSARAWRLGLGGTLLGAGVLVDEPPAIAQSVIANQTPTVPLTSEWQQEQPNETDVFAQPPAGPDNSLPGIFRYGPYAVRPHFDYRFLYGNGILAAPGDQQSTLIQELSPGLLFDLGPHWVVDYTPTIRFYSSSQFRDGVDQAVSLAGGFALDKWQFGVSHSTQFTTLPMAGTGAETEQTAHVTDLNATRQLTQRMSTTLDVNQQILLVSGFQDSYTWSTLDWLNYQFWARFVAGRGVGGG